MYSLSKSINSKSLSICLSETNLNNHEQIYPINQIHLIPSIKQTNYITKKSQMKK